MILARPFRLLLLFVLFVLVPLGLRPMWIPDESRYAEIAREMLESGDWVVPTLLGMHYFEKPVAGYWFTAVSQAVLGENLFASRLPGALATGLSALVVGVLAQRMWHDPRKAWIAVLVYLSFVLVSGMALYITLDPQLAFWLNLALLGLHVATTTAGPGRRLAAWALLGAACGMAFLTKGFVAWLLAFLVVVPYMLWQRRLGGLLRFGPMAVLVAVATAASWGLAVQRQAPDFWNYFFWNEHIRRFAGANAQHGEPFWFYLPVLVLGCLPWLGMLVPALRRAWAEKQDANIGFLLIWLLFPLVFLSLARGKLPTYILPCFTPLALLLAHTLAPQLDDGRPGKLFKINGGINGVIGITGLALLLIAAGRGIYTLEDRTAWLLAAAISCVWLVVAAAQWWRPLRYWELSALPLWLLWICLPKLLTQDQIDSKEPSVFIQSHIGTLSQTRFLLGNDPGLSADLAWNLRRTDITVYGRKGELEYGLATPAGFGRFVSHDEIGAWISSARRQGSVTLVLRVRGDDDLDLTALPKGAALRDLRNKLALVSYSQESVP